MKRLNDRKCSISCKRKTRKIKYKAVHSYGQHIRQSEEGRNEFYPFDYIEYYEAKLMPRNILHTEEGDEEFYDGLTFQDFLDSYKDGFPDIIQPILNDKRLEELQAMLESEGKQVCMFNITLLSMFIVKRAKSRYAFLLKPTIEETLASLSDVKEISFTNGDGNRVESTSKELIEKVMEMMNTNTKAEKYEVEKIVSWDKICNKSVMQCYFVHELTTFLNSYFPVKRKKDAKISTTEVKLILYLMKLTGVSNEELTNKRYWQLLSMYEKIEPQIASTDSIGNFDIDGKPLRIKMFFLPYSVWSGGKVDWSNAAMPKFDCQVGTILQF